MKDCSRMELLTPPLTTVAGVFLSAASCIAIAGNSLVLVVVYQMKAKRTRSIVILSSLACSDFLVGTVLGPITAWQQLVSSELLGNCLADMIRGYFVVLLVGSSVMTLAVVSYDRYILLTKLQNYNKHMTKRKASLLIAISWTVPALVPIIRQFNANVYLVNIFILYMTPLIVLGVCYFFIMKAVRAKELALKQRYPAKRLQSIDELGSESTHETAAGSNGVNSIKKEQKHLRLAKTVALLIVCYTICIIPMNVWIALEFFKDKDRFGYQILYLCAMLLMQINSCINPIIYFSRNPDFKRGLKRLLQIKKVSTQTFSNIFQLKEAPPNTEPPEGRVNSICTE